MQYCVDEREKECGTMVSLIIVIGYTSCIHGGTLIHTGCGLPVPATILQIGLKNF